MSNLIPALTAKKGVRVQTHEQRVVARAKSTQIYEKNLKVRESKKSELYEERAEAETLLQAGRDAMLKRWVKKTATSPFAVGLHAEDERIVEENKIRTREEAQRRTIVKMQKEQAKNEIILTVSCGTVICGG